MSLASWLAILALVLFIVEAVIFGFSTLFLIFVGIGCLISALLMYAGLLEQSALWAFVSVSVFASLSAVLLWKPMRKLQNQQQDINTQPNDIDGLEFRLSADLSPAGEGQHRYSGIVWKVLLAKSENETLPAGTLVKVVRTEVGSLFVAKA